ncbi:Unknown protein, partial [Striga hermonthica]
KSQEDCPRHVSTSGNVIIEADSPLAPELTAEALPAKVKIPQIGMYDGTLDPDAHLGHYTSWMDLHGASDALRCRMFSLTLGPRAQKWYYTLPPQFGSSNNYVQLSDHTSSELKFALSQKNRSLISCKKAQYRNYSKGYENTPKSRAARDQYADNMRTGYQTIYSAGASTIFKELKGKGIIHDPKPVRTSEDKLEKSRYCAYHKSSGHNTDECLGLLSALLCLIGQPQLQKFRNFDNRRKGRPVDLSDEEDDDNRPVNPKRVWANDKEGFTFSTLVGTSTDNCKKPKTHDALNPSYCIPRVNSNTKQLDTSRRKAKSYAREAQNAGKQVVNIDLRDTINKRNCPITFSIDNANLFAHPHSDALIITAPIGGVHVHRIMVDTGAYSSILMFRTFKKLGLDPADIRPCNDHIQGFNISISCPIGEILLPIRF